ncbi:SDR family NAD(P)-dependent oxidoreductase [Streptomyces sp. ID05-04B]|uniref:SDR family NAD(P)-dependent oxidoreductase n=1 Tax=Streptomyces sp. ID05-04B TaxID=3028661 RepID=UPI0029C271D1|nr:SDR family NAD(P)-dependent oxidoreductase [Streptomyces sp. ID05-04B]MDX5563980.1 SDR family NAD(P)-dependent oxidoreductase [Streptomyces sp. ID05-04B]
MSGLSGLKAVVTGGASGIGLATSRMLAEHGATVAVIDLDPSGAPEPLIAFKADLGDDASVRAAVRLGGLDILVNNAGIGAVGTVEDNPDEEWHRVLDVNVLGMVRTTRAALPYLRRSSHAAVVNTCSIGATAGLPQRALYCASKGAVLSLTLAMAADHVREGIALLHDPDHHVEQALTEAYPALERLCGEGVVKAIGIGDVRLRARPTARAGPGAAHEGGH